MKTLEYIYNETEKSVPLNTMEYIEIPKKIEQYIIDTKNIIAKTRTSIICRCTYEKNEYVVKFCCGYDEDIIDKIYEDHNSEEQLSSHLVPLISKGYISGGIWYQIYPFYKKTLSDCIEELTTEDIKVFLRQINCALKYLHSKLEIIHMDIKPENIFINENGYFLGDYDAAQNYGNLINKNNIIGTKEYVPIEDIEKETVYSELWDYATLGNVLKKILSNNTKLDVPYVRNIIKGLTNSTETRWSYNEIEDICSGKHIDSRQNIKPRKLNKVVENNNLLFGFDENSTPIVVNNLEELGKCLKKYRNIALKRHINNQNGWEQLIRFVKKIDNDLGLETRTILTDRTQDDVYILDRLSRLFYKSELALFYKGNEYPNLDSILVDVPKDTYDDEFIHLTESEDFKSYLAEKGNEKYKEAFEKINSISFTRKEIKYYLILYYLGKDCSFENEMVANVENCSNKSKLQMVREKLCLDIDMLIKHKDKLEAWLILQGYGNEIETIMEVSNKYEQ